MQYAPHWSLTGNHQDGDALSFLQGLHGVVALALLNGLLFAEEAGVPLPFAPGELVLLTGGLLIATGGVDPFLFIPIAMLACGVGSFVGYSWARIVGERGLTSLARRLHQQRNLERVSVRVRSTGWLGVGVSRLIPGLRIYTTLVAGALRVGRQTFLGGMIPSTVIWVGAFTALGALIGIPVEHFLNKVEKYAVEAGIVLVMGLGSYLAIRRTPPSSGAGLVRLPYAARAVVAAVIDLAVVGSIVTGLLALGRRLFGVYLGAGWLDGVIAMVVAGILYVVVSRRGAGGTVGESLLQTSYVSAHLPRRPHEAWQAARALLSGSDDDLQPTAELLRALADTKRLRLVRHLLDENASADTLAERADVEPLEVRHQLDRLLEAGVLMTCSDDQDTWQVKPDLVEPLLEFLSATHMPSPKPPQERTPASAAAGE